jgi:hypothetical protein
MLSKIATLLKKVLSATKRPELPEDHTWSQASMTAQRAKGEIEALRQESGNRAAPADGAQGLTDSASA